MKKVRSLKDIQNHEGVAEVFSEDNDISRGIDYWINLNVGYVDSEDGNLSMHEYGIKALIIRFNTYIQKEDVWIKEQQEFWSKKNN